MHKIVISGPESSGKTDLSVYLADQFRQPCIPEYARDYVQNLGRPYSFEDVEHIARVQWDQYLEYIKEDKPLLIMDTFLIITKIWCREVYGFVPAWIDQALENARIDLYLLCYPDLEWEADRVRENPGKRRIELFENYHSEIIRFGFSCEVIRGTGQERYRNAMMAVQSHFPQLKI